MKKQIPAFIIAGSLILLVSFLLSSAAVSAADNLASFKEYLSTLDKKDPQSINRALDYCKSHFGETASVDERDQAFMEFRGFYYSVIDAYNPVIYEDSKLQERLMNPKNRKVLEAMQKKLAQSGITLKMSEGTYYVNEEASFLLKNFSSLISSQAKEYLRIREKEIKEGYTEDAGLVISWKDLAERIAAWDRFISSNSTSAMAGQAKLLYDDYLAVFLTGTDNSRVFDEKNRLVPEVRKVYEYYIQKYGSSKSGALVKKYYAVLKKNGFTSSKESEKFLKDHRIRNMIGVQPE